MRPSARTRCCRGSGRAAPGTCRGRSNCNSRSNSNSKSWQPPVGWRGGSGCGGRRKSPDRPSRWRLCVRALAKQCFAIKAPSPMEARSRHPWRSRPRNRTHPAFDNSSLLLVGVDLGRHGRSTPCVDALRSFDQLSKYSISMEIHPRMAWIYQTPGNCRRRGGVGLRGVRGMDAAAKPTRTYLRRPRHPTPPRHPTERPLLPLLLRLPASGRHYHGCRAQPGRNPEPLLCRLGRCARGDARCTP
ncbi:hypothetical protein M2299_002477 [Stenotrophomonas sp. 1278]|nr:hypothetical protein [Stenotrophomonas sp. 1278]